MKAPSSCRDQVPWQAATQLTSPSSTTTPSVSVPACLLNRSERVEGWRLLLARRTKVAGKGAASWTKEETSEAGLAERDAASKLERELEDEEEDIGLNGIFRK